MSNTLSKINLSKIGWEGGWSTLIWIMSLNILFFLGGSTPKNAPNGPRVNANGVKVRGGDKCWKEIKIFSTADEFNKKTLLEKIKNYKKLDFGKLKKEA